LDVLPKAHEPPIFLRTPQLNINLYGLCEAAWHWYCGLSSTLTQQGLRKHPPQSCLWLRQDDPATPASRCYFLMHMDDSLTMGRKAGEHYNRPAARYEMKDMSLPQLWCGIEFTLLPGTILMHQTAYRKHFAQHWRKHPVHPLTVTPHLSPIKDDALRYKADAPGHTSPGTASTVAWPTGTADITPGSTLLFRGLRHVNPDHEAASEHILGYIHAHPNLGFTFDCRLPPPDKLKLLQHVYAEQGRNRKTSKSDEGQVIKLKGNLVSWSFKGQTIVAANPYHSEVSAFSNGTRQLQKIHSYIIGCGDELGATPVFEDNYGRDNGLARASRTLAQHFHFGRDQQQLGLIDLRGEPSADNLADFFTKPVGTTKFQLNVERLGMRSVAACKLLRMRPASTGAAAGR
jgi:hypothetical protein